jgi:hypothetical protein
MQRGIYPPVLERKHFFLNFLRTTAEGPILQRLDVSAAGA